MANRNRRFAKLVSFYKAVYERHYIPYLYFYYGGEYLHYSGEQAERIVNLPQSRSREAWEKAP